MKKLGIALAVFVLGGIGHWSYHYSPREREARPGAGGLAAALLAATAGPGEGSADLLWIPYPHQNLGALADSVDDPDAYLETVGKALEIDGLRLPRFGPFRAPPARELVVVSEDRGDRILVAAKVFPTIAVLARLAGSLASNPYLAGGDVRLGDRAARVRWEGTVWRAETLTAPQLATAGLAEAAPARDSAAVEDSAPSLGWLVLSRRQGPVPPGRYQVRRVPGALEIGPPTGEAALGASPPPLPEGAVAAAFRSRQDGQAEAALIYDEEGRSLLPGAAVLHRGGKGRWKLPGESVLTFLRGDLPEAEAAGWAIKATDRRSLDAALDAAPRLTDQAAPGTPVRLALWLRPARARLRLTQTAKVLRKVPIVGARQARRWSLWADLLAPFEDLERIEARFGERDGEMRLLLWEDAPD